VVRLCGDLMSRRTPEPIHSSVAMKSPESSQLIRPSSFCSVKAASSVVASTPVDGTRDRARNEYVPGRGTRGVASNAKQPHVCPV
jgi:hypothetical protein